jgi:hypothetical protein
MRGLPESVRKSTGESGSFSPQSMPRVRNDLCLLWPVCGKQGLVDLEGFEPSTSSMPSFWSQSLTSIDTRNKRLSGT